MRNSNRLGVLTLTLTAVLLCAGPALAADVSVGEFVQELARATHLDAATPQEALDSLAAAGLRLPSNLDMGKRLTELDVTEISRSVGLNLTTSRPGASFSSAQVDQFLESFINIEHRQRSIHSMRKPVKIQKMSDGFFYLFFNGTDNLKVLIWIVWD